MRAVDTNVLVRAFVQDDPDQARSASMLLAGDVIYVPVSVVLELEWILRSRYEYPPDSIADAIEKLAVLENAVIAEQDAVIAAARHLRDGWDFADALHHALSKGCEEFVTFDRRLARRAGLDPATRPKVVVA